MSRFLLTSLLLLTVIFSSEVYAAPSLVYSTMAADSTWHSFDMSWFKHYSADVDSNGNLYIAAPMTLAASMNSGVRVYRVNPDGTNVDTVLELPDYQYCRQLSCTDSGIYIRVTDIISPKLYDRIIKFTSDGTILYTTDWSYPLSEANDASVMDAEGNVYLVLDLHRDSERIAQIPVTENAFDKDYNGLGDIVIQKYDPDGNLLYSSFYGGSGNDGGSNIAVDEDGLMYIFFESGSEDLPLPFENPQNIYVGGSCLLVISPDFDEHHLYPTMSELSLAKMVCNNNALFSLYVHHLFKYTLTGAEQYVIEMLGETPEFLRTSLTSYKQAKISDDLVPYPVQAVFDPLGRIYSVHNLTPDTPFTTTPDALCSVYSGSTFDLGIWQFTENLDLLYGTYFGGSGREETTDTAIVLQDNKLYVAGYTSSLDFPLTPGSYIDTRAPLAPDQFRKYGLFAFCIDFSGQPVAVDDDAAVPAPLILDPPHPNPFNPQTTISFTLPEAGLARLAVYDISGQLVRELTAEVLPAGRHEIVWDGRDSTGATVGSGVYIARLVAGEHVAVRKVTLVR